MRYHIWLSEVAGVSCARAYALIQAFGSAEAVYRASAEELAEKVRLTTEEKDGLANHSLDKVIKIIGICRLKRIDIITISDKRYPDRLRQIWDPPTVLYVRGRLPEIDEKAVIAIVGSRKPAPESTFFAESMAEALSSAGMLVVSGLAAGVDSDAQKRAVTKGFDTVAVLGTAIDRIYPKSNTWLAREIERHGALVSEYPPGKTTYPSCFVARNRIISGLSVGVLLIQAHSKSGSLSTANRALDQNRELFVSPGPPTAPEWEGSNALLKEGACITTTPEDVLGAFRSRFGLKGTDLPEAAPAKKEKTKTELSPEEAAVYAAIDGASYIDDIVRRSGLKTEQVQTLLTMMELSGAIIQLPGQIFERN